MKKLLLLFVLIAGTVFMSPAAEATPIATDNALAITSPHHPGKRYGKHPRRGHRHVKKHHRHHKKDHGHYGKKHGSHRHDRSKHRNISYNRR